MDDANKQQDALQGEFDSLDTEDKKEDKKNDKKEATKEQVDKIENIGSNINNITTNASTAMNESNDKTYGELMKIMDKQKEMIKTSRSKKFKKNKDKLQ